MAAVIDGIWGANIIVEREFLFWAAVVEIKPDAIIIEEKNTKDPW